MDHQEIPQEEPGALNEYDIEKAQAKEEIETDRMLNSDESSSNEDKPFRLEDDKCIRCLDVLYKIAFILLCITSVISLIKLFTGYNIYLEIYQKFNQDTTMKLDSFT